MIFVTLSHVLCVIFPWSSKHYANPNGSYRILFKDVQINENALHC